MAPKLLQKQRVPLGAREVQIIRRLKNIVKLLVTRIAWLQVAISPPSTKLYLVSIFQGKSLLIKVSRPSGPMCTSSVMILPSKGAFEPCMT